MALTGARRRIDVGRIDIGGKRRSSRSPCGVGFDAEVMERTDSARKARWGSSPISRARSWRPATSGTRPTAHHRWRPSTMDAAQVLVANFGRLPAGLQVRGVRSDDGLLDVFVIRASGPLPALLAGWEAIRSTGDGESDGGRVFRVKATTVRIETQPSRRVETDGSSVGRTPISRVGPTGRPDRHGPETRHRLRRGTIGWMRRCRGNRSRTRRCNAADRGRRPSDGRPSSRNVAGLTPGASRSHARDGRASRRVEDPDQGTADPGAGDAGPARCRPACRRLRDRLALDAVFAFVADRVYTQESFALDTYREPVPPFDLVTVASMSVMNGITSLGSVEVWGRCSSLATLLLVSRGLRAEALFLAVAIGGSVALNGVMKVVVERPRPAAAVGERPARLQLPERPHDELAGLLPRDRRDPVGPLRTPRRSDRRRRRGAHRRSPSG